MRLAFSNAWTAQDDFRVKKNEFFAQYKLQSTNTSPPVIFTEDTADVKFWCQYCSWTYCKQCGSLETKKMLPSFRRRSIPKSLTSCGCTRSCYTIPQPKEVPAALRGLNAEEIRALRPLQVFCGPYERRQHGYRVRTGAFDVRWHQTSVEERIRAIEDPASRQRTHEAYKWLITSKTCPYKRFLQMRRDGVRDPWLFEIFTHEAFKGVEAALWPHLYHHRDLCESYLQGQRSRASSKVSFVNKMRSAVLDYSLEYELLHYHYDRWLFKTVTGAINTAAKSGCSPAKSLKGKTFSHQY